MNTITREQLQSELANPQLVLLEALPEPYFKSGHLPRARSFPVQQARELATTIAPDASIVVYCASDTCKSSHQVAKLLEDAEFGVRHKLHKKLSVRRTRSTNAHE